jgi:hypothetical protein
MASWALKLSLPKLYPPLLCHDMNRFVSVQLVSAWVLASCENVTKMLAKREKPLPRFTDHDPPGAVDGVIGVRESLDVDRERFSTEQRGADLVLHRRVHVNHIPQEPDLGELVRLALVRASARAQW